MLSLPPQPVNVWGTFSSLSNVYLGVSPVVDRLIVRYHVHIIPTSNLHLRIIVLFKTMGFFRPRMTRRSERHWACLARCEELLAIGRDCWNVAGERRAGVLCCTQTENIKTFQVACSGSVQWANVSRVANSNSSFNTKSCACVSVALFAGIISLQNLQF